MKGAATKAQQFDWTLGDRLEQLRRLWGEGRSGSEIAKEIGTTKSSVVGKAHRLGLPARPNPVQSRVERTSEWWTAHWTDERDDMIRRGYSPRTLERVPEIARKCECSTTSVSRRAQELGLRHPSYTKAPGRVRQANVARASARIFRHPATAPDSRNLPLGEIGPHDCRFPVTPHHARIHLFCGASKKLSPEKSPYCPFHHALAHHIVTKEQEAA